MLKEIWEKLTIRTNEPEFKADELAGNNRVRNVKIYGNKVTYEQKTWRESNGYDHNEHAE